MSVGVDKLPKNAKDWDNLPESGRENMKKKKQISLLKWSRMVQFCRKNDCQTCDILCIKKDISKKSDLFQFTEKKWQRCDYNHTTLTIRNKWEKLKHIGEAIFDIPSYEAMLKVWRKSWEPFRIYQQTSTANPAQFYIVSYSEWPIS